MSALWSLVMYTIRKSAESVQTAMFQTGPRRTSALPNLRDYPTKRNCRLLNWLGEHCSP